ncbi:hypothetical protein B0A55_02933 [Friedmanniomyces simplex]|uniref:Uncharacterized protein n=1 Tax=Friedmanniomyces simplex TaxID=329884 RepID=A0A4U0XUT0_9PEZI|nr:hypothetical protein B0A55_02933 [Friedmanniomyces simplex]
MSSDSDSLDDSDSDSDLSARPDNALILQCLNDFEPHRYPTGAALVPDRTQRVWHNSYPERTRRSLSPADPYGALYSADGSRISSLTTNTSRDSSSSPGGWREQQRRPGHEPGQQRYYRPASRLVDPERRTFPPLLPPPPQRELRRPYAQRYGQRSTSPPGMAAPRVFPPSPLSREAEHVRENVLALTQGPYPPYGSAAALGGPRGADMHDNETPSAGWLSLEERQPRDSGIELEGQCTDDDGLDKQAPVNGVQDVNAEELAGGTMALVLAEAPDLKKRLWSWEALPSEEQNDEREEQQPDTPSVAMGGSEAEKAQSDALVTMSASSSLRRQPAQQRSLAMRSLGGKFGIGRRRGS